MFMIRLWLAACCFVLALNAVAAETIRQTREVMVDGQREKWILKWSGPVKPVCAATALSETATCPCSGFAYGEQGQLLLERKRGGRPTEVLDLSPLFAEDENPADSGNAALAHFPRYPNDPSDDIVDTVSRRTFQAGVLKRAPVDVMQLHDFARDGMQASFLLQVGNTPCGKREMMLVGVSRSVPHLHAFTTISHPERPLVLQDTAWRALLASDDQTRFTDLPCGDHGSEEEIEKVIRAHSGKFTVRSNSYTCHRDGSRGRLLRSEQQ